MAADIVIILIDGSTCLGEEDVEVVDRNKERKTVLVVNKSDLPPRITDAELADLMPGVKPLRISAKYGSGISELRERIFSLASDDERFTESDVVLTNLRHKISLEKSAEALTAAKDNISLGSSPELSAFDIRDALHYLGDIAGETMSEDVLDRIFSNFCIGK